MDHLSDLEDAAEIARRRREIMKITERVIAQDPRAKAAFYGVRRARGLSRQKAKEEITRALMGCLWESSHGMPNRFEAVMRAIEQGQSTEELFPDALYEGLSAATA
jgi:hypothetical protein